MEIKLESIQNDVNTTKKHTILPINQRRLMAKTALSYSVFLLIILILLCCLFNILTNNTNNSYTSRTKYSFINNVEAFETNLSIMDYYCYLIIQDSRFKELAVSRDTHADNFLKYGNELASEMDTDAFLETILPVSEHFCYLPASGYVITSGYFNTLENYCNQNPKYGIYMQEAFNKAYASTQYNSFIPIYNSNLNSEYYLYIIDAASLYPSINLSPIVCFIIENEQLASLFRETDIYSVSIYTQSNDLILSFPSNNSQSQNNAFNYTSSSTGTYQSEQTNFIYYYSYPDYVISSIFSGPQLICLLLFIFLGSIGLIVMLSKHRIKPIVALERLLQSYKQENDMLVQELSMLTASNNKILQEKNHILEENDYLLQENNNLMQAINSQKPLLCNSYARQLLKGYIVSEKEASYARTFLGLKEEGLIYNSLYIITYNNVVEYPPTSSKNNTIDSDSTTKNFSSPENRNNIVLKALKDYLQDSFFGFSPSDKTYALIMVGRSDDEKDLIIKANEMIVKIHNELLDTYGIWLFAGIGKNTDNIVNVWESYQQAIEAASYISKKYIFVPYEFINKDSSVFYYPTELSTKLIHFITTGNTPQVLELFNLLHQENIEERALPIKMLQFLLSDIRNTLLKARLALPATISEDVLKDLDKCFDQHISFKLCEDIALKLCKLFTTESNDDKLISSIEKYIKENYSDPSMGLNKISDEFQISESYFSHMFKEKTGVNFSTYLETIRLNEAARLIRETDTSLNELYILIGYNNANSFRRAFKKVYGITPSAMRDTK